MLQKNPKMRFTTEQALRHPWWVSVIRLGFTDSRQACHVFGLEQKNKKQIKAHRFPDPVTSHTVQELVNINDAEQVHALGIKYKQTQMYLIHDWFYYWVCNFQKETFSSAGVKGKIVLVLQRVKRNIWNIGQKYRRVGKKKVLRPVSCTWEEGFCASSSSFMSVLLCLSFL